MATSGLASDADLLARAVGAMATRTGFPVAFGGFEHDDTVEVTSVAGARTPYIDGLVVHATRGLGGRALVEHRPRLALDYKSSRHITHDYDRAILGEGISTLFAVPVMVAGRARGVLYAGAWGQTQLGDQAARSALSVASDFAVELRVRDEVQRRLALVSPAAPAQTVLPGSTQESLRELFAELRGISADVRDAGIRARLQRLERRMAGLTQEEPPADELLDVRLSPREVDVLACAALGSTNAEIAATLVLREGTVKSYLQSAMSKLDASTRHAAVAKARRAGLLP
ncbi:LuxR C-terminal-related transcriptional regulator [Microbacterium sp. bgisy189]|uniref:LuxR C-terminal-related transcriptional regulator n=1 Tax=Microbacterium sp. bgisy189 TaxID=3413798 RepID=UPI003EBAE2E8